MIMLTTYVYSKNEKCRSKSLGGVGEGVSTLREAAPVLASKVRNVVCTE